MKDLDSLYYYDESSPTFLRWKVCIKSGRYKNQVNVNIGDVAGSVSCSGYYQVRNYGRLVLVHRVIWQLFNGVISENNYIDHIDGNKLNNALSNLRVVSRSINARNHEIRKDNTSGLRGVTKTVNTLRSGRKIEYWRAFWRDLDGKNCSKAFRIDLHGDEVAYNMAVECRKSAIMEMNESGAGYTDRHIG